MTASPELGLPTLTVSPGGEATTTLTVRNETDIVEAYSLEVVGECAPWTTVQPARVSLYPGTSETVSIRLAPPRSSEVRAGQFPLGIRVLPAERPELVTVPETTVTVTPFHELRADLAPRRRRGWLRARYRTGVQNLGNTDADVAFGAGQAGEDLRFAFTPTTTHLEPGESAEVRLRARTRKVIWFGKPVTWAFEAQVNQAAAPDAPQEPQRPDPRLTLNGEFIQLALLPKWLLAVLAAIIALLIAWFALVRPTVQSSAEQAAAKAVRQKAAAPQPTNSTGTGASKGGASGQGSGSGSGNGSSSGGGSGRAEPGTAVQSSATVDVKTSSGGSKVGSYRVPDGKVFGITDIVVANFQGDQGLLTIKFGQQTITTIALETFRNQDYHWVTPIDVLADQTVTASVTCEKPGTPASGRQASECHELLNVSGELSDLKQ